LHPTKFGRKSTNDMNSSYILIIVCCCFSNHSDTCLVVSIVVSYNWNTVLTTKFVEVDSKPCERQKDYWSNLPAGFGFHSFHRPGVPCITSQALTSRPTVYTSHTTSFVRTTCHASCGSVTGPRGPSLKLADLAIQGLQVLWDGIVSSLL